jgi:hypothetical protein
MQRRMMTIGVVACVLALVIGGLSFAQPQRGQRGEAGGQRGGGEAGQGQRGQFDRAQMQERMMERMMEQLSVDAEARPVFAPRLQRVMDLNRQTMAGGPGGMFGGGRGPGGQFGGPQGQRQQPGQADQELSPVQKARTQLQTTLENSSASPDQITRDLRALRAAQEKARQELAVAQKSLQEICTARQEAQLVVMGLLQ